MEKKIEALVYQWWGEEWKFKGNGDISIEYKTTINSSVLVVKAYDGAFLLESPITKEVDYKVDGEYIVWKEAGDHFALYINKEVRSDFFKKITDRRDLPPPPIPFIPSPPAKIMKTSHKYVVQSSSMKSSSKSSKSSKGSRISEASEISERSNQSAPKSISCSTMDKTEAERFLGFKLYDELRRSLKNQFEILKFFKIPIISSPDQLRENIFKSFCDHFESTGKFPCKFIYEKESTAYVIRLLEQIIRYVQKEHSLNKDDLRFEGQYDKLKFNFETYCECSIECNLNCECRFKMYNCRQGQKSIDAQPDFAIVSSINKKRVTVPIIIEAKNCCADDGLKQLFLYLNCCYRMQKNEGQEFNDLVFGFSTSVTHWYLVAYDGRQYKMSKLVEFLYPAFESDKENWLANFMEVVDVIYSILSNEVTYSKTAGKIQQK